MDLGEEEAPTMPEGLAEGSNLAEKVLKSSGKVGDVCWVCCVCYGLMPLPEVPQAVGDEFGGVTNYLV